MSPTETAHHGDRGVWRLRPGAAWLQRHLQWSVSTELEIELMESYYKFFFSPILPPAT